MKKVTWLGGPNDGEEFSIPDAGESMDVYIQPVPEAFLRQRPNDPPRVRRNRVARVPVILTKNGWRAMWHDRIERDT